VERECSAAAVMLGLPGFVVLAVSDNDGECEQAVETTADLVGPPECAAVTQLVPGLGPAQMMIAMSPPSVPFRGNVSNSYEVGHEKGTPSDPQLVAFEHRDTPHEEVKQILFQCVEGSLQSDH
jgi:hypothetical protein